MSANSYIPLHALTQDAWPAWLEGQDPRTRRWAEATGFRAETGQSSLVPDAEGGLSQVLCGLGEQPGVWSLSQLPSMLPSGNYEILGEFSGEQQLQLALGFRLGCYRFDRYRSRSGPELNLNTPTEWAAELERLVDAVAMVRDLVNTPTEDMGPEQLSQVMATLAEDHAGRFREIVGDDLLAANLPAIHAVGRAASRAPRLLLLDWGEDEHPTVTLVGKGVCFDTGGLNLKGATGMRFMKKDMGGAAHALGLARLIMDSELPVRLRVLIPAVENAVAGNAYRPGDVIQTRKGLTVEIHNTDAEGRVVLCDALAMACEARPELIMDFATLTGAARVALGPDLPPVYANDDGLAGGLLDASERSGDPLWRMPLFDGYESYLDSGIADLSNCAEIPMAGSITAALYLQRFVEPELPWAHFDVYAWNRSDRPGRPAGGEAQGLRAAYAYLQQRFA